MPLSPLTKWTQRMFRGRSAHPASRSRSRRTRLLLERLEDRVTPSSVIWTGAGDGINWSDPHNWDVGRLPGSADDVTINAPPTIIIHGSGSDTIRSLQSENPIVVSGGSLTLATDSTIDDELMITGGTLNNLGALSVQILDQTGGTLIGSGSVTIQTEWDWNNGIESGTGHTILLGNATFSSGGSPQLIGRTVDNDGTATLEFGSTLRFGSNGVWNNQADGTFILSNASNLGSGGTFNNAGLLQLAASGGNAIIGATLNNTSTGTLDVQNGNVLFLNGGGASSGSFDLEGTSAIQIGGTYALKDGASSSDTGTIRVPNFSGLTVTGSVSVANLIVSGGSVTLNSGASLDVGNLRFDSSFSTVTGPGDFSVEGDFTWNSGGLGGTGHTVLNGTTEISGGFFATLTGRTVDNHGTATLLANTGFDFSTSGVWNNDADGTLILQKGSSVGNFFASAAVINNDGLVQMLGNPGDKDSIDVTLNNSAIGTVDVEGGLLTLTTGSSSGTFFVANTGNLAFNDTFNPAYTLQDGATSTGPGFLVVNTFDALTINGNVNVPNLSVPGGTITINGGGSLTVGNLSLNGLNGTVTGGGDLAVNGNFNWIGGTLSGTGGTFLEGFSTLSGGFFSVLNGRSITNDGTVTVLANSGITFEGNAVWNNQSDGTLILLANSSLGNFFSNGSVFNNAGLVTVNGPGASIGFSFVNSGTVTIGAGRSLNVGANYTQTDGLTTVDGTLTVNNTLFLNGGFLNGSGTINGNVVNAAEVDPGDSPGVLTINGNYTQTGAGTLTIEIGGPNVGSGYDRLVVKGTATLAGAINIVLLNGFVPTAGTSFQVLTFFSHVGDFDTYAGLDLGNGLSFVPGLSGTGLTLVATQS
jgi:hypothetical protein